MKRANPIVGLMALSMATAVPAIAAQPKEIPQNEIDQYVRALKVAGLDQARCSQLGKDQSLNPNPYSIQNLITDDQLAKSQKGYVSPGEQPAVQLVFRHDDKNNPDPTGSSQTIVRVTTSSDDQSIVQIEVDLQNLKDVEVDGGNLVAPNVQPEMVTTSAYLCGLN